MASPVDEEEIIQAGPSGVNLIPRVHLGLPKITEEGKQWPVHTGYPAIPSSRDCRWLPVHDCT